MSRLVVIGGDAAGMSAAARASRGAEPPEIVVFERGEYTSYAACGLPYHVSGLITDPDSLVARTPEEHRDSGIDVRMGQEVVSIDPEERSVSVRSVADGRTYQESYDELLIATGASPIVPNLPNVNAQGITTIKTIPDAVALDALISERAPENAVVIGGGYIGLEMAEALVSRGLKVTLIEMLEQPMATLDPDMGERVADALRELGVSMQLGVTASGFEVDDGGWVRAVASSAGEIPAELVVLGLGFRPNVSLAVEAGVPLGPSGAIAVDARMATRMPHVWAADAGAFRRRHRHRHNPRRRGRDRAHRPQFARGASGGLRGGGPHHRGGNPRSLLPGKPKVSGARGGGTRQWAHARSADRRRR